MLDKQAEVMKNTGRDTVMCKRIVERGAEEFDRHPDSYNPRLGGVIIDETNLIARNSEGRELLRVTRIDDIGSIRRLLDPELEDYLGTLLCGWT